MLLFRGFPVDKTQTKHPVCRPHDAPKLASRDFLGRLARRLGAEPTDRPRERFENRESVWRTVSGHQHPDIALALSILSALLDATAIAIKPSRLF
jgi:hypothetical protein